MDEKKNSKVDSLYRPNWHPELSRFLKDIKGQYGYVTDVGTIELLGPLYDDPEISKYSRESKINGPLKSISAVGKLGI